jgi:hypothetical protein
MQTEGWIRIGRFDKSQRRAIWARRVGPDTIEVRGGREGDDTTATLFRQDVFRQDSPIFDVIEAQLWALEMDGDVGG